MIPRVARAIEDAKKVLIVSHRDPDGDALGSSLGMANLLLDRGREIWVYSAGPLPEEYGFLPGMNDVKSEMPPKGWADLAILLDCHQPERAGELAAAYLPGVEKQVVVDHHLGRAEYGDPAWIDASFAATGQMVAELAWEAGWEMNPSAATCLFVGLQTDTGSFRYANATAGVFRSAARLVEHGAEPWPISQEVYATRPRRLAVLGRVLEKIKYEAKGRMVLGGVTLEEMNAMGVDSRDLEDVVEVLRGIPGVEVSAMVRERPEGGIKASLRARGEFDVAKIALSLGGGGHKNAAGFLSPDSLEAVSRKLVSMIAPALER